MIPPLQGLTFAQFFERARSTFLAARGEIKGSGVASALYGAYFRSGVFDPAGQGLPPASVELWSQVCSVEPLLNLVQVAQDEAGVGPAASKAVFRLHDGLTIEAVLVPMASHAGGRGTLCLSSQAGCAMGCAFCETGRTGLLRNLTAGEIVAQVHQARFELGWDFSSLVFMGMGEPLHNLGQVIPALEVLTDGRGLAFAQDKITVCTVGLTDGIDRLATLGWKRLGLSLSLNAGSQAQRQTLMPAGITNHLTALQTSLSAYPQRKNFVLGLNYCLIPGVNDAQEDAQGVADFARDLGRVLVNVIPYNPGSKPLARAPFAEEVDQFVAWLAQRGLEARVRGPKGRSIMAACGQLGGRDAPRRDW